MNTLIFSTLISAFMPNVVAADTKDEALVQLFFKDHCVRCHNATTKKGKFELHDLKTDIAGNNARFAAILERLRAGDMPPEKEPQPDLDTLKKMIDVIQAGLGKSTAGVAKAVEVPVRPGDGNHLPHSLLFGGKPGPSVPPPARLWRLSPEGYSVGLLKSLNLGAGRISQPFSLHNDPGIKDYAALYWIDDGGTDIRRVQSQLAGPERESLDRYLEAYESMLDRDRGVTDMKARLQANMPNTDKFKSRAETDRLQAQCEMAASALLSGLTKVVTISACAGNKYMAWTKLGMSLRTNAIGHGGGEGGKTSDELLIEIRKFHVECIAALAKRLDAVKEGSGTVLDNTLIVYMSDYGDKHHPSYVQWPVVLLGNLGGRLKTNGRYLEYPRYGVSGHKTLGTLYHSLLHAVGDNREKFGNVDLAIDKDATHGPLSDILA